MLARITPRLREELEQESRGLKKLGRIWSVKLPAIGLPFQAAPPSEVELPVQTIRKRDLDITVHPPSNSSFHAIGFVVCSEARQDGETSKIARVMIEKVSWPSFAPKLYLVFGGICTNVRVPWKTSKLFDIQRGCASRRHHRLFSSRGVVWMDKDYVSHFSR